jgi:hypothetical protein
MDKPDVTVLWLMLCFVFCGFPVQILVRRPTNLTEIVSDFIIYPIARWMEGGGGGNKGWMGGWLAGWVGGWLGGWMDGLMDEW